MQSLGEIPLLFGKKRLWQQDMESLQELVWSIEGTLSPEEKAVTKFIEDHRTQAGRTSCLLHSFW